MSSFTVYWDGKPAQFPFYPVDRSWGQANNIDLATAVAYANAWLDASGPLPVDAVADHPYIVMEGDLQHTLIIKTITAFGNTSPPFGVVTETPRHRV